MTQKTLMTCEEFERIAHELGPCELIDGEVVTLSPGGTHHSFFTGQIHGILREFVRAHGLGRVMTNEAGLHVRRDPPRSRGADILFISYERLPKGPMPHGFLRVPPELIVEVFGDEVTWPEMEEKIEDDHGFGVDMVWVADPQTRTVKKFPRGGPPEIVHDGSEIDGGAALPGFRLPIARFFDED